MSGKQLIKYVVANGRVIIEQEEEVEFFLIFQGLAPCQAHSSSPIAMAVALKYMQLSALTYASYRIGSAVATGIVSKVNSHAQLFAIVWMVVLILCPEQTIQALHRLFPAVEAC